MYVSVYVCMCVRAHTRTHTDTYIHTYIHTYICIFVCNVCVYTHSYPYYCNSLTFEPLFHNLHHIMIDGGGSISQAAATTGSVPPPGVGVAPGCRSFYIIKYTIIYINL